MLWQAKSMRCKCDVFLVIQHAKEVGLVSTPAKSYKYFLQIQVRD
jgi:hypothetical protein